MDNNSVINYPQPQALTLSFTTFFEGLDGKLPGGGGGGAPAPGGGGGGGGAAMLRYRIRRLDHGFRTVDFSSQALRAERTAGEHWWLPC